MPFNTSRCSYRYKIAAAVLAAGVLPVTAHAQNLVTNPGFESPGFAGDNFRYLVGSDATLLTGWTTTYDGVQEATYVFRSDRYETVEGDYTVYLNDGDSISTTVTVVVGQTYRFSFDNFTPMLRDFLTVTCAGSTFTISSADSLPTELHGSAGSPVYRYSHTFTAMTDGPTTLVIQNPQNQTDCFACGGSDVDFVQLIPVCACRSDFNCDGFVNSQDFFDFLAAFFAVQPAADFNHDTFINSQDFFDFLAAFFAGC